MALKEGTTEFNSNLATLERIDTLLKLCRDASFVGDLDSWFRNLRNLRKEAIVKMKGKDEKYRKDCETMYEKLVKIHSIFLRHRTMQSVRLKFEMVLDEFEIFLRDFMDYKGMLLTETEYDTRGM